MADEKLQWVNFEPGDEPSVLTADLCAVFGCEKCPGFTTVGAIGAAHPDPDATVFCTHWCHEVAPGV